MIGYAPGSESQFFFNSGQVVKGRRLATLAFMGVLMVERNKWKDESVMVRKEHENCRLVGALRENVLVLELGGRKLHADLRDTGCRVASRNHSWES